MAKPTPKRCAYWLSNLVDGFRGISIWTAAPSNTAQAIGTFRIINVKPILEGLPVLLGKVLRLFHAQL